MRSPSNGLLKMFHKASICCLMAFLFFARFILPHRVEETIAAEHFGVQSYQAGGEQSRDSTAREGVVTRSAVRVCSQNLNRYGKSHGKKHKDQESDLVERVIKARCDVLGVQELYGESKKQATRTLVRFIRALEKRSGREYDLFVGESQDPEIRNAVIYDVRIGKLLWAKSYGRELLPKLQPLGPNRRHLRAPVGLALQVRLTKTNQDSAGYYDKNRQIEVAELSSNQQTGQITLLIINYHFKSKVRSDLDPTQTQYESERLASAAHVHYLMAQEIAATSQDKPLIALMLGDRNSGPQSASAGVLRGRPEFNNFLYRGGCEIDESLRPSCPAGVATSSKTRFIDLLDWHNQLNPHRELYSYRFRSEEEIIDEILVWERSSRYLVGPSGPRVQTTGNYRQGSDHRLVWAEIRLPEK